MRLFLVSSLLLGLSACAQAPTRLLLDPDVPTANSAIGSGQLIALSVSGTPEGQRLGDSQSRFALEKPAAPVVQAKLQELLPQHGFQVGGPTDSMRQLRVTVIAADHVINKGIVRDNIRVKVALQFTAETESGTLTRNYEDSREQEVAGRANIGEAGGVLNQSLGSVLRRALNDGELMAFLAR